MQKHVRTHIIALNDLKWPSKMIFMVFKSYPVLQKNHQNIVKFDQWARFCVIRYFYSIKAYDYWENPWSCSGDPLIHCWGFIWIQFVIVVNNIVINFSYWACIIVYQISQEKPIWLLWRLFLVKWVYLVSQMVIWNHNIIQNSI